MPYTEEGINSGNELAQAAQRVESGGVSETAQGVRQDSVLAGKEHGMRQDTVLAGIERGVSSGTAPANNVQQERSRSAIAEAAQGVVLALDTSTAAMTVAVMRGGETLAQRNSPGDRNHGVQLLPAVQELMQSLGLRPRDLAAVIVGAGPGSYTGVRIAVSAAKTLAWTLRVPLVGVSSLAGLAQSAHRQLAAGAAQAPAAGGRRWFVPLLNARRGQAFTAVYDTGGGGFDGSALLVERAADGIRLVRDWADELRGRAAASGEPLELVFCGETAGFEETLQAAFPGEAGGGPAGVRALALPCELEASAIGAFGLARLRRGEADETHTFVPNYTQLTEAEVKLLAKQKQGD